VTGSNLEQSLAHYRELAPRYDRSTRWINGVRARAIGMLGLRAGETVLDAGCGTGWCLPRLAAAVGPRGRVIAFDPSPDMLAHAALRVPVGTGVVEVVRATAEDIRLPVAPDAILFSYTHDLVRSHRALENLFAQAKPGARVAATGTKLYGGWLVPANWFLRLRHRGYITDSGGLEAPWSLLASFLEDFRLEASPWSQHYLASGKLRARAAQSA